MISRSSLLLGTNTVETDPNFGSVSLLLHMDGSNDSSTFTDSSINNLYVRSPSNLVKIKTAQSKFGGASAYFPGNGVVQCDDPLARLSTGDHTVELWAYSTSTPTPGTVQAFFAQWSSNSATGRCQLTLQSDRTITLQLGSTFVTSTITVPINTWVHIAYVRNSGVNKVYINGVEALSFTATQQVEAATVWIGARQQSYNFFFGYIDEVRLTPGVARYTEPFTPPIQAFLNS